MPREIAKIPCEWWDLVQYLTHEERGRLFTAILEYSGKQVEEGEAWPKNFLTGNELFVWPAIKAQIRPTKQEETEPVETEERQERFETFWNAYPKKMGKAGAKRTFDRIKMNDVLFTVIMKALEAAKHSPQWKKDGGQYVPNPQTWLNQGRWMDDPSTWPKTQGRNEAEQLAYDKPSDYYKNYFSEVEEPDDNREHRN